MEWKHLWSKLPMPMEISISDCGVLTSSEDHCSGQRAQGPRSNGEKDLDPFNTSKQNPGEMCWIHSFLGGIGWIGWVISFPNSLVYFPCPQNVLWIFFYLFVGFVGSVKSNPRQDNNSIACGWYSHRLQPKDPQLLQTLLRRRASFARRVLLATSVASCPAEQLLMWNACKTGGSGPVCGARQVREARSAVLQLDCSKCAQKHSVPWVEDHGIKVSKGGLICIWIRTARFPIVEKAQQWSTVALIRGNTHNKMVDAFNLFGWPRFDH